MPTRPAVPPAPKPLSPRAAQFVRKTVQREAQQATERQNVFLHGFDAGVASVTLPVRKAKDAGQIAVFDSEGNLVGVVDADSVIPVQSGKPPAAKPAPAQQQDPAAPADGTDPAMAPAATAKGMSLGVRNGHQLGGPTPRGGVPVIPAMDAAQSAEVAQAHARELSAELKKALNGGNGASAAEAAHVADAMNRAALAKFREMQRRGLAPGGPRRG